jgi:hypothetical protein
VDVLEPLPQSLAVSKIAIEANSRNWARVGMKVLR